MRHVIGLLAVVALASTLAGCGTMGPASNPLPAASSVGPDTVTTDAATDTSSERLAAGMQWLWASVSALRDKLHAVATVAPHAAAVAAQALDKARMAVSDVEAAVKAGNLGHALVLWTKARSAIGTVANMVQGLAATSAAGV